MRVRSCETYWLLKNGLINTYPSLHRDLRCDVLVVGAGITGALMAFQFASEGYDTVLIDRNDVALGSTSATTALLQYEIDTPLYILQDMVGETVAQECYREGVKAIERVEELVNHFNIHCGFERRASVYVAHNRKHRDGLLKEFYARRNAGLKVEWLSDRDLAESYGVHGTGAIRSADAACLDAYCMTHALLTQASSKHPLQIYDHTEIDSITYRTDGNDVRIRSGVSIHATKMVFATGYESHSLLKDKVADLISTYACVSEPLETMPVAISQNLFWTTHDPYLYVRSTSDSRILVGGADVAFKNAFRRAALIDRKETDLVKQLKRLIPDIDIIPDFTWAGTFGVTKDSLPYIGPHPDFPNCYFVLGFGGNGITFSVMGMKILSDALAGADNPFLHYFRFDR